MSIVTISFNQAKFVEETLNSVINQSYPDIEYIVLDAGSTDGSREIIRKYEKSIAKIIFEPDNGPSDGLNKGFSRATGDIFGFVNADDILLPAAVRKVVEQFECNLSADIVYGNGYVINGEGRILRKILSDAFDLKRFLYGCVTFIQPSVYFRREAFEIVHGFNVGNRTCWDGELMIDFGKSKARFLLLNDFLSSFRVHPTSFGSSDDKSPYRRQLALDRDRLYAKVFSRQPSRIDLLRRVYYRIVKWWLNPRSLFSNVHRMMRRPFDGY